MKKVKILHERYPGPMARQAEKLISEGWEPVGGLAVGAPPMGPPILAWAFTKEDHSELGDVEYPQPIG